MRHPLVTPLAAVLAAALVAVGCGGDDDEEPSASPDTTEDEQGTTTVPVESDDVEAYCDASLAFETTPQPDLSAASDEEAAAWVRDELLPQAEAGMSVAPEEISDDLATLVAVLEQVAGTGDFSAFGEPDVKAAEARVHAYDLDNCGWTPQPVSATEYSFGQLPTTFAAGPTSFEFSNDGSEVHEMLLAKKNPGVTESAAEIVAMPEEQALTKVTEVGSVFGDPGETDFLVADLQAGEYIVVCFVPIGMTSSDAEPPPDAEPHYTAGMVAEFSVS